MTQYPSNHSPLNIKIIIVGDAGVGKTSLLHWFIFNKFQKNIKQTINVEYSSKIIRVGNFDLRLQLWDTAGQEIFKAVTKIYYRKALGVLVVFDLTDVKSFESVKNWIKEATQSADSNCAFCVIGNKSDLKSQRKVTAEKATSFCRYSDAAYFECSALTGENVAESFSFLAEKIVERIKNKKITVENLSDIGAVDCLRRDTEDWEDDGKEGKLGCGCGK